MDSIKNSGELIGDLILVEAKVQSLEHRRNVSYISVIYKKYNVECKTEYTILHGRSQELHPYDVDILQMCTKRYASTAILTTEFPTLWVSERYNLGLFKTRENIYYIGMYALQ